jgi:hypothetical protein
MFLTTLRSNRVLQRVFALFAAVCIVCASANPVTFAGTLAERGCAGPAYDAEACASEDERSADKSSRLDVDKLSGTPHVPFARSARRWFVDSVPHGCGTPATTWLRSPAHDPPRTIRFCTLLI